MGFQRNSEPGRQAVLWLATAFVVLIGAAACVFIIVAAVEDPSNHLLATGALFTAIVVLLASMAVSRDKQSGKSRFRLWLAMRGKSDPRAVLRIGRKKNSPASGFGTNAPPTLESVRDAAEQNVTWVPHGPSPDRSQRSR